MANAIPDGLSLDAEEQKAFYGMSRWQRVRFNTIQDNKLRLVYIQAIVDAKRADREKPVCLANRCIYL